MVTSTPGEYLFNKTFIIKLHHILATCFPRDWYFHYSLTERNHDTNSKICIWSLYSVKLLYFFF